MAHNQRDAQPMMRPRQLLAPGSYNELDSLGKRENWTSASGILDARAGSNLIKQSFALMTCSHPIEQMKAVRLRSAGSFVLKLMGSMTTAILKR